MVCGVSAQGARVAIVDPWVKGTQIRKELSRFVPGSGTLTVCYETCQTAYDACSASAMVIITDWNQFSNDHRPASSSSIRNSDGLNIPANGSMAMTRAVSSGDIVSERPVQYENEDFAMRSNVSDYRGSTYSHREHVFLDWRYISNITHEPNYVFDGQNMPEAWELKGYGLKNKCV